MVYVPIVGVALTECTAFPATAATVVVTRAVFVKVDSKRLQRSAMMLNVRSLPTFIFFHKTSPVHTFTGADAAQLLQTVQTLAAAAEAEGTHASPEAYPTLEEVRAAVHRGTPRPADDRGDAPGAREAAITAKAEEIHAT